MVMTEWNVNQLLFADDTALVAESEERLRHLVDEFGRVCKRKKLRVNESNNKVVKWTRMVDDKAQLIYRWTNIIGQYWAFYKLGICICNG